MEEESVCSSLPDVRDPIHQQESWTPADPQLLNGQEEEVDVWGRMEVQIEQTHETELSLPPKGGLQSSKEAEQQWEQTLWPVFPMTCTAAPFPCATVQWDTAEPSSEAPEPSTDSSSANEPDSGRATSLDATPLSLHHSEDADGEFFSQEDAEEQDAIDLLLPLNSSPEWTENSSQVQYVTHTHTEVLYRYPVLLTLYSVSLDLT